MKRPTRRQLLDGSVVAAIVLVLVGLLGVPGLLGSEKDDQPGTRAGEAGTSAPITHATLGPTPTPTLGPSPSTGVPAPGRSSSVPTPARPSGPALGGPSVPVQADPDAAMASLAAQAQQKADAARTTVFRIASFNVLGASHTTATGDSRIKRSYSVRMNYAIQALAAHKADVVGFQEFETRQARLFTDLVGPVWGLWPTAGGGGADGRNSIGYLRSKWELVTGTSLTIPYFNGQAFRTPVALLKHRTTGRTVWFISVHNAADTRKYRNQGRWRAAAVQAELAEIKRLHADGTPVVLLGDMNSRDLFYCTVVNSGLGMTFPNPGSGTGAGCVGPTPSTIDWILGTPEISWAGYLKDRSQLTKLATDHPVYSATGVIR